MITGSNTTLYATKTGDYPAIRLASGLVINSDTQLTSGQTYASIITDILFRNLGAAAILLDIFIGVTATTENNKVQVSIPANAGNNGSIQLAQLSVLAPALFDLDLAGNRYIQLEPNVGIYIRNKAALTADMWITAKRKNF